MSRQIICPSCQQVNRLDTRFCRNCGQQLEGVVTVITGQKKTNPFRIVAGILFAVAGFAGFFTPFTEPFGNGSYFIPRIFGLIVLIANILISFSLFFDKRTLAKAGCVTMIAVTFAMTAFCLQGVLEHGIGYWNAYYDYSREQIYEYREILYSESFSAMASAASGFTMATWIFFLLSSASRKRHTAMGITAASLSFVSFILLAFVSTRFNYSGWTGYIRPVYYFLLTPAVLFAGLSFSGKRKEEAVPDQDPE